MRRFIVVYQFGKVGSTALVQALNGLPETDCIQSHFLGVDALREVVPQMVNPRLSDYFFRHLSGQFARNIETTRRMNAIKSGLLDEHLITLTLSRNPVEWMRSAITQDINGILPGLRTIVAKSGNS